jgi:hypothetical protein
MNENKLQDFVAAAVAKSRITFGDVRRLGRDTLPDGILNRTEAEILIGLDAKIERADRAWSNWLVAAVVDFAIGSDGCLEADALGTDAWLEALLATSGASPETRRRITRDIRRDVRRAQQTPLAWEEQVVQAVVADAAERAGNTLQLAA